MEADNSPSARVQSSKNIALPLASVSLTKESKSGVASSQVGTYLHLRYKSLSFYPSRGDAKRKMTRMGMYLMTLRLHFQALASPISAHSANHPGSRGSSCAPTNICHVSDASRRQFDTCHLHSVRSPDSTPCRSSRTIPSPIHISCPHFPFPCLRRHNDIYPCCVPILSRAPIEGLLFAAGRPRRGN